MKVSELRGQLNETILWQFIRTCINPLSPSSDQCQFTPNSIHTLPRDEVMRINKMINQEKMP